MRTYSSDRAPDPRTRRMLIPSDTECQTSVVWKSRCGATGTLRQRYVIRRLFPKRRNWTLEGKKDLLLPLTEKETHSDWLYFDLFKSQKTHFLLRRTGDHFLTCLNKPKYTVWAKLSFFKAGCSSWRLTFMKRSAEKRILWKITPSARVKWEGRFCYKFTHPSLGESNLTIF